MINIVIPMAGRGRRFAEAGYALPKPLIPVRGRPMIEVVIDNLRPRAEHRFIFVCLAGHIREFGLEGKLAAVSPGCAVVPVSEVTAGAACTVLLAEKFIDNGEPLMIANSDQYVEADINAYLASGQGFDGLIMTMTAHDDKWSFVRLDGRGLIAEVREKEVISSEATVGVYNFARGADFVSGAREMIAKNIRVNGEFYVAPVYNALIGRGLRFTHYNIGGLGRGMFGLGVPEDLEAFLKNPVSERIGKA
ncbi:MAG: glycosyltransferase family 2 protein [Candidatus Adiutrix sp.]|jgi:NDP-sugar pyrophosphorylase family protein|nr:glycosyltransferase family 2 protein [Candidatus Adiutrix sp.]